jgi:formiminoglutamate deiminase
MGVADMSKLFFDAALLPDGWARDVTITVDAGGRITAVTPDSSPSGADRRPGVAVPGIPNVHSHAFQRGIAGLTERRGPGPDSFWTWRQVMYSFLDRLEPEDLEALAAQAYLEMLEAGFTAVGEFHYVHHDPAGHPYADPAEMSGRIAAAASSTGIGLTLLPVFYAYSDFGGKPAEAGQRRFVNGPDDFLRLVDATRAASAVVPDAVTGIAPHSLRAVTADGLGSVIAGAGDVPVHIHVAEQQREVDGCLAAFGKRPVEWLLDGGRVDDRWCLVHATHTTTTEIEAIAATGAVVGLCPITEANLGDGIFSAGGFLDAGGRIGIGSDSNVFIAAAEELRLMEYGQRLRDRVRNVLAVPGGSVGRNLVDVVCRGGARALGRRVGALAAGYRGDIVVLDADHPALIGKQDDGWLDGWIFAGDNGVVREVWVHGRHVVENGRHRLREGVRSSYAAALARLLG